jgi:hypothetical protein
VSVPITPSPQNPRLGRLPAPDPRDLGFLLRSARPAAFTDPLANLPTSKHYARGIILDQGFTGTCVEHGLEAKLRGSPVKVGQSRLPKRFEVYDEAIRIDEFTGNDNDTMRIYGTSVRAGCKALVRRGLITSYHWTYTMEEILQWVLGGHGGLVLGIDWYSGMNNPDPETGIIRMTGTHQGGHCIYMFGADRKTELVSLQQSWGAQEGGWVRYGKRVNPGCVRLPFRDLKRLLDGNGEAVAIIETPYSRRRTLEAA